MLKRFLDFLFGAPIPRRTEGYNFAKSQLKAGLRDEMENFVDSSRLFGSFDDFDRGIEDALREDIHAPQ